MTSTETEIEILAPQELSKLPTEDIARSNSSDSSAQNSLLDTEQHMVAPEGSFTNKDDANALTSRSLKHKNKVHPMEPEDVSRGEQDEEEDGESDNSI